MNQYPVPPLLGDMIARLENPSLNSNEKNNIAMTLELIGKQCIKAASDWRIKFDKEESIRSMVRNKRTKKARV